MLQLKKQNMIEKGNIWVIAAMLLILLSTSSCGNRRRHSISHSSNYIFGIDISHYQGHINWNKVSKSKHPIKYVFIRSSMGTSAKDKKFSRNWKKAKKHRFIRGAYHYYRPDENSTKQFENFKSKVKLSKGDLPPVLDVEVESKKSRAYLRKGVKNWLKLAEKHYGVKPIIYTSRNFYKHVLKGHIDGYTLWIADYSGKPGGINWRFHQFTDQVSIKGISQPVDGNNYKGSLRSLKKMCI